jgi:hypothetical protein
MRVGLRATCLAAALFTSGCGGVLSDVFGSKEPEPPGVEAFEFDEAKLPVGVVFHYTTSSRTRTGRSRSAYRST